MTSNDKSWETIEKFLRQNRDHGIIQHQLNSFHDFVEQGIPQIITSRNPMTVTKTDENETTTHEVVITNPRLIPPTFKEKNGTFTEMFPYQARIQNLTYASALLVDFTYTIVKSKDDKKVSEERYSTNDIIIGYIPIMLQSKYCRLFNKKLTDYRECEYDRGGYFIVKGQEKVIISQEKFAENRIFFGKKPKNKEKYSYFAEIKSVHPETQYVYSSYLRYIEKTDEIRIKIPKAKDDISIITLFKVLGCKSDKEILDLFDSQLAPKEAKLYHELLMPSFMENKTVRTREDAIHALYKSYNYVEPNEEKLSELLQKVLIPHIGDDLEDKILYLVHAIKCLMDTISGKRKLSDRDNICNKRIDTAGTMMSHLFRYLYQKFLNELARNITNPTASINIGAIVKSNPMETGFRYALSTGQWHIKNETLIVKKVGVAQVLNRFNYYSTLSHLRRINSELDNNAKLTTPRQIHGSSIMAVCVAETPEGHGIGITKNLAMLATITNDVDPNIITDLLYYMNVTKATIATIKTLKSQQSGKVLVNGKWIGACHDIVKLATELRSLRRVGKISEMTSIKVDYKFNELYILTTGGRFVHPVFVVENNHRLVDDYEFTHETNWKHLIRDGIVEYIDVDEAECCMIAMTHKDLKDPYIRFTHCEIHPSAMLGLCGSLIPFSNHTQSPRVAYQASMCKQAVSVYASNYKDRMDSSSHVLWSPQRPIVDTKITELVHANDLPSGQNLIVAFGCYSGFNIEDSIIMNKSAAERGLFRSTFFRTYKDEEKKDMMTFDEEQFCNPRLVENCRGIKIGSYEHMDRNGFVQENTFLRGNDVIIGKVTPESQSSRQKVHSTFKDISTTVRANESGVVDRGIITTNQENYRLAKVRLRQEREPTVGDKLASRSSQKGTMGLLCPEADMPVTADGIVPDIIVNSHGIPSRMTMSQLLECVYGKVGALDGELQDGTTFKDFDVQELASNLEKFGFQRYGNETMYNGQTGKMMKYQMFIGPTYYQRLKHMTADKKHARARGPILALTHQPAEGRSRLGGQRKASVNLQTHTPIAACA